MNVTAAVLAVLAVLLADPVPRLLMRAHWVGREPVAALLLWQAVGLGAGMSLLGAGAVFAFAHLGDSLPAAVIAFGDNMFRGHPFIGWDPVRAVVLALTVVLGLRLFWTLVRSIVHVQRSRQRQRDALGILATPWPAEPGVLVLDHPTAVAYCLPGSQSTLVVSRGTLDVLTAGQLRMVLAHERAHLRLRHDLVVLPFVAWGAALPFIGSVRRAQRAVAALVEMMADDAAVGGHPDRLELRAALDELAGPVGAGTVALRTARLAQPARPAAPIRRAACTAAVALILVPTAIVVVPWFI